MQIGRMVREERDAEWLLLEECYSRVIIPARYPKADECRVCVSSDGIVI